MRVSDSSNYFEVDMSVSVPLAFAVNERADIHDIEGRTEADAAAFSEIRAVLEKYNLLDKYGISLLHKHFDLKEDEILVEYTDIESRTLTLKPTKMNETLKNSSIETAWALNTGSAQVQCVVYCYKSEPGGQHTGWEHIVR